MAAALSPRPSKPATKKARLVPGGGAALLTTPSSSKSNLLPSCFTPAWPAEGVLVASSWLAGLGRTGMQRSGPPHGDAEK